MAVVVEGGGSAGACMGLSCLGYACRPNAKCMWLYTPHYHITITPHHITITPPHTRGLRPHLGLLQLTLQRQHAPHLRVHTHTHTFACGMPLPRIDTQTCSRCTRMRTCHMARIRHLTTCPVVQPGFAPSYLIRHLHASIVKRPIERLTPDLCRGARISRCLVWTNGHGCK